MKKYRKENTRNAWKAVILLLLLVLFTCFAVSLSINEMETGEQESRAKAYVETLTIIDPPPRSKSYVETSTYIELKENFLEYVNKNVDIVYLLAQMIQCEAGATWEERVYVGSVVLNRMRSSYWKGANSIIEVLSQPGQYPGTYKAIMAGKVKPSKEALEVAQGLIDGTIPCLEEYVLYQVKVKSETNVVYVELPGAIHYYGVPKNFWGKEFDPSKIAYPILE